MDRIMMSMKNDNLARPAKNQIRLRLLTKRIADLIFPYHVLDEEGSMVKFEHMLNQGYGFIVIINHFSTRDSAQVLAHLLDNQAVGPRPILAPVAYHQHNSIVQFWSQRMAIELCPIVTARTVEALGDEYIQGAGLAEYASLAMDCLRQGGVLLLAPQGGRQSTLGEPEGRPLGNLLALARRRGVEKVALMFIGLGYPGVADYSRKRVGGANIGKRYELRIGQTITTEEAIHLAGGRRRIDAWSFQQLRRLVPAIYGVEQTLSSAIDAELKNEHPLIESQNEPTD